MTMIYVLTVHDGDDSNTTIHASLSDAETCLRDNYDQEPADYPHLTGIELMEALEQRDELEIALAPLELEISIEEESPTVDDLLAPQTTAVYLTKEEIILLRSGLAAHSTALYDIYGQTPEVREQQGECRELTNRLYAAQIALNPNRPH